MIPSDKANERKLSASFSICHNENFPSPLIELLVKANPSALRLLCKSHHNFTWTKRLPLHCYLYRTPNVDIDTVKMIVEAYPEALIVGDDKSKLTLMHNLLSNPNLSIMNKILQFIVETEPSSLRMTNVRDRVPLHVACENKNIDPKTVQLLLNI